MTVPIGIHSERLDLALPLLKRAGRVRLLVSLDLDPGRLAAARPYADLIVARYDPQGTTQNTYLGRGEALADLIAAGVQPVAHLCDAVAVLNEPPCATVAEAAVVAQTVIDAADVLHACGLKVVGGNFSAGTPPLPTDDGGAVWRALLPMLRAVDYLGVHEYASGSMQSGAGWRCGRILKALDYLGTLGWAGPVLVTECGIDFALPDGRPSGYRANGVPDARYLADLQWYAAVLAGAPQIKGAAVFEGGAFDRFQSFDLTGTPLGGMLADWLATANASGNGPQSRQDGPGSPVTVKEASLPPQALTFPTSTAPSIWRKSPRPAASCA